MKDRKAQPLRKQISVTESGILRDTRINIRDYDKGKCPDSRISDEPGCPFERHEVEVQCPVIKLDDIVAAHCDEYAVDERDHPTGHACFEYDKHDC